MASPYLLRWLKPSEPAGWAPGWYTSWMRTPSISHPAVVLTMLGFLPLACAEGDSAPLRFGGGAGAGSEAGGSPGGGTANGGGPIGGAAPNGGSGAGASSSGGITGVGGQGGITGVGGQGGITGVGGQGGESTGGSNTGTGGSTGVAGNGNGQLGPGPVPFDKPDNFPATNKIPGGLSAAQTPMFVMLGFDDNVYADGVSWIRGYLVNRKAGGQPIRGTFFNKASSGDADAALTNAWRQLAQDGHEMANHTFLHAPGASKDKAWWLNELTQANEFTKGKLGYPAQEIHGFRTPFLEFGPPTFAAMAEIGIHYDTSVEFGYDWWADPFEKDQWGSAKGRSPGDAETGRHYMWPFTLDTGVPIEQFLYKGSGPQRGIWEFPVYTFNQPDPTDPAKVKTRVTGFDFNLFKALSCADALTTLKFSFDQRRSGNKSPFSMNLHSDYYSAINNPNVDKEFTCKDHTNRQKVLTDFIEYAQGFADTRFVPFVKVIEWMRSPKAL